jgi:hypothetical protein
MWLALSEPKESRMGAPSQQQIEDAIVAGLACGDSEQAMLDEVAALADVAAK